MKKSILLLLLFLTSCLALTDSLFSSIPTSNHFIERFPENKKGIILLKLNSDYLAISWCQADLENDLKNKNCIKINPSKYYQIIMLEAGWYEIDGYRVVNRRFQSLHETKIDPIISNITKKRKTAPQLAFEVVEGKISYVGNIKFHHVSTSGTQIKADDFLIIENAFAAKNQKQINEIFKGHNWEANIIAKKIFQDPKILQQNLAKTRADFAEEKQIIKKEEREAKKIKRQFLKERANNFRLQKKLQKQKNLGNFKLEKLKDYQN